MAARNINADIDDVINGLMTYEITTSHGSMYRGIETKNTQNSNV